MEAGRGRQRSAGDSASATERDAAVAELRRRLAAAVRRSCPAWLAADAEDIVQEATMRVLDIAERDRTALDLPASYLHKAAYSAVVDEIRRRSRRADAPASEPETLDLAAAADGDPEARVAAAQVGDGIAECLRRLPVPRRVAVTLHLQGHSVPAIARLVAWSTKKSEHLVYRGLDALRRCLTEKGLTP